jgi:hypothetical protein
MPKQEKVLEIIYKVEKKKNDYNVRINDKKKEFLKRAYHLIIVNAMHKQS